MARRARPRRTAATTAEPRSFRWLILPAAVMAAIFAVVAIGTEMRVVRYLQASSNAPILAFVIFAAVLPLEFLFGTPHRPTWSERLGNLGAMLVHFVLGSAGIYLVFYELEITRLVATPGEPRLDLLSNPWLYALAYVALVDLVYYGYHRLQHAVPFLWHIHKLHHTDPAMNITTAKRTHFLEPPLQALIIVVPAGWILGSNPVGLSYALVVLTFFLYFGHANFELGFGRWTPLAVAPQYHRLHHRRDVLDHGSNFAQVLPLWDLLGGTYERPQGRRFVSTGVEGCDTTRARWQPIL